MTDNWLKSRALIIAWLIVAPNFFVKFRVTVRFIRDALSCLPDNRQPYRRKDKPYKGPCTYDIFVCGLWKNLCTLAHFVTILHQKGELKSKLSHANRKGGSVPGVGVGPSGLALMIWNSLQMHKNAKKVLRLTDKWQIKPIKSTWLIYITVVAGNIFR